VGEIWNSQVFTSLFPFQGALVENNMRMLKIHL